MKNWIGKYVIVRINKSGVSAGKVEAWNRAGVTLVDGCKIWNWTGALCMDEIASKGITGGKTAKFARKFVRWEEGAEVAESSEAIVVSIVK